jgi:hypothetical protein
LSESVWAGSERRASRFAPGAKPFGEVSSLEPNPRPLFGASCPGEGTFGGG